MKFQQAKWDEALLFERSRAGAIGYSLPAVGKAVQQALPKPTSTLPKDLRRSAPPALPELSEPEFHHVPLISTAAPFRSSRCQAPRLLSVPDSGQPSCRA